MWFLFISIKQIRCYRHSSPPLYASHPLLFSQITSFFIWKYFYFWYRNLWKPKQKWMIGNYGNLQDRSWSKKLIKIIRRWERWTPVTTCDGSWWLPLSSPCSPPSCSYPCSPSPTPRTCPWSPPGRKLAQIFSPTSTTHTTSPGRRRTAAPSSWHLSPLWFSACRW